jgi:outer membrane protein assembly factor BamB
MALTKFQHTEVFGLVATKRNSLICDCKACPSAPKLRRPMKSILFSLYLSTLAATAQNWPEFRGPTGDGQVPATTTELPLEWSEEMNVAWKTPIPGRAWSTPVIWGDQVWVTNATEDGKKMSVVCVDKNNGKILLDKLLFENESPEPLGNDVNGYGSCSPAIEEGRIFVHFGSYGTACLDTKTFDILWQRRDLPCRHYRGPASSVVLWQGKVILSLDGVDVQYLVALDPDSGKTIWKTDRTTDFGDVEADGKIKADGDLRKAYTTPGFVKVGDQVQMISTGAKATYAYNPDNGKEIWHITYDGFSNASRPVFLGSEWAFINTGFGKAHLLGVKLDPEAKGDITDTHIKWDVFKRIPNRSSPVVVGDRIFLVDESGIISCLNATTGEVIKDDRLRGHFSGSLIHFDGRLYIPCEQGQFYVIEATEELKLLATNTLDDGFMASPAVSGNSLFLRSKSHLYRISNAKK